ncbi:MAG: NADH-quinone oxidoreductase subunit NuoK [Euryarchaeota archaeon]|nr:NADH-quinone oxidoreductase subunit NuoK [Euryarchaeota archaeon]
MIPLSAYLVFSAILFCIGLYGVLTRKNAIVVLMSIDIMLNAANVNFVAFSAYSSPFDLSGQVFAALSIAIAAAEVAVGLAILLVVYRVKGRMNVRIFRELRW